MYNSAMTSEKQNLWHSEDELRALLRGPENEFVERKRGFDEEGSKGVLQTVCAFANDYPDQGKPGVVFIGVDDKSGKPLFQSVEEKLLNQLAGLREDPKFSAPLVLKPSRVSGEDGEVAALQVAPSNSPPIKFLQRVYIRIGASTCKASWEEEHQLSEMRLGRNPPFDISPFPRARLDDLNLAFFREEYLPAMWDAETLQENSREITAQLAAAKMIARDEGERSIPTILGLLILGRQTRDFLPGAYVQFLRIDSNELDSDPVDEEMISGTILEVARRLREKLRAHNRVRVEYVNIPEEKRKHMYPELALLQVAYNALMHRRYKDTNAPVRVYWFNNRIEIDNPGGLHGEVRAHKEKFPGVECDYRNPNLAEAMKALGLVQKFGSGLGLAKQALEKNGSPPMEWDREGLEVHVRCILRPADLSGDFRMSTKSIVSLAQFLHMFGTPGHQLLRKHGIGAAGHSSGGMEALLERAESGQLRGLLDEIGRTRIALLRQVADWGVEKERRESKDADAETYNRRMESARETAEAAFAERFEDLRICLREDGYRLCE